MLRSARASLLALAGYAAAALLVTAPAWLHATTSLSGNVGDPYKFIDWLAWIPHAISQLHNPFFTGAVDAPRGVNLAWEGTVPLGGLVVWPVTATLGPLAAYNVWLLIALTLDGWCTYLWLRMHVRPVAAFVAGLTVALGPYLVVHGYGHLNLVSAFPIPLLFLVVERFLRGAMRWWRAGIWAGVLAAAQLYLAEELFVLAVTAVAAGLVAAVITGPACLRRRPAKLPGAVGLAVLTAAILAGPMLAFQFFGPLQVRSAIQPPNVYVTDLQNVVVPTALTWLHPGALSPQLASSWTGNIGEQTGYIGIPMLLTSVYALCRWWREHAVRAMALATLMLAVLSLGPHLHIGGVSSVALPGLVFGHLPVLDNLLPGRLSLVVALGLAWILGITLDRTVFTAPRKAVVGGALSVLSIVSLAPAAPIPTSTPPLPSYFTASNGARAYPEGTVALVAPYIDDGGATAVPMLWQAASDFHLSLIDGLAITVAPNGHPTFAVDSPLRTAFHSIQVSGAAPEESQQLKDTLTQTLNDDRVSLIVVGPMPHREVAEAFVAWLAGTPGVQVDGVTVWRR